MKRVKMLLMILTPIIFIASSFIYFYSPTEPSAEKAKNSKVKVAIPVDGASTKPDPHLTPESDSSEERQYHMVDNQGNRVEISDPTPLGKLSDTDQKEKNPVKVDRETTAVIYNEKGKKIGEQTISQDFIEGKSGAPKTEQAPQANQAPQAPTDSQEGDNLQRAPGAKRVMSVLVAADEEYRAANPDWMQLTAAIMETTNQPFMRDHQIDFQIQAYAEWKSDGAGNHQLLEDLDRDWNKGIYDFVVGFTKDRSFTAGGMAYVYPSPPTGSAVSLNLDQGRTLTPYAVQHELSHNLGLHHDAQGSGKKCVMNYDYMYQTNQWDPEHHQQIAQSKQGYGRVNNEQPDTPERDEEHEGEDEQINEDEQTDENEDTPDEDTNRENPEDTNEDQQDENHHGDHEENAYDDGTNLEGLSDYEKKVVELINQERQKHNLKPLEVDPELSKVARIKSEDMKEKDYFSHYSPTYGSPSDMLKSFNISFRYGGENLASFYATPEDVVAAWMYSPNHRCNILSPHYTHMGIGHVTGGHFAVYWTNLFIAK